VKRVPIGVDLHPGFTSGRWLMLWEEAEESEDQLGWICTIGVAPLNRVNFATSSDSYEICRTYRYICQ
jgi:hypothetical protein